MEQKKDFIKVRVFLILKEGDVVSINDNASFNGSESFVEEVNTYDEEFRSAIITFINDSIGLHNWAVRFAQFALDYTMFDVVIYAENEDEDGLKIKKIVEERITDRKLNFYYGGTIDNYYKKYNEN